MTVVKTTPKANKIVGKTAPEFNGITVPTLRAWAAYWASDKCKDNPAITAERTPAVHLALITKELEMRGKSL